MDTPFISDRKYQGHNFARTRLPKGEYENCVFTGCDFSGGYLDSTHFLECHFEDCNLSNANLKFSRFKETEFLRCKLLGLRFEDLDDFLLSFRFKDCALNLCSFVDMKLRPTVFEGCILAGADFTGTDANGSSFDGCDLQNAIFWQSGLGGTDFRNAVNFNIDPENNDLKKARFNREALPGLLTKYGLEIE